MWAIGNPPRILKELGDVERLLINVFKVLHKKINRKKENICCTHLQKEKGGGFSNYKLVGLMSVLREIVKQMLLKCFGNQNRKVIGNSHLGLFTKGKYFLTTLDHMKKWKALWARDDQGMLLILNSVSISEWIPFLMSNIDCI